MNIFLKWATQPSSKPVLSQRNFLGILFTSVSSLFQHLVAPAKQTAIILSLLVLLLVTLPAKPAHAQGAQLSPRQVVEYALTLEKLEADFYRRAINAAQSGGPLASAPQI